MKDLLFLSHRIPYPPDKGEKIRAWHILRHLARTHRIHLGCFIDDPLDWTHVETLRAHCADLHCVRLDPRRGKLRALAGLLTGHPLSLGYFHDAGLQRWVNAKLATGIDRVFAYCSAMAPYAMPSSFPPPPSFPPPLAKGAGEGVATHRVLDMVDVDSTKWRDYAASSRLPTRLIWSREARTLLAFERQAVAAYDHTLLVSAAEAAHFAALDPASAGRISALANGVDLAFFCPELPFPNPYPSGARPLVFTGTMDYRPNIDAMTWFIDQVMPLLRAGPHPVSLAIVGANPAPALRHRAAPDITITGRVPDTRPYLAHAAIAVAPLRIARGIQNKVLEAMAMARPVVASPQAHEGIAATLGRDLLLADTASAWAARITEILAGAYPNLPHAARTAMERGHSWEATLAPLAALFTDAPPVPAPQPEFAR